ARSPAPGRSAPRHHHPPVGSGSSQVSPPSRELLPRGPFFQVGPAGADGPVGALGASVFDTRRGSRDGPRDPRSTAPYLGRKPTPGRSPLTPPPKPPPGTGKCEPPGPPG